MSKDISLGYGLRWVERSTKKSNKCSSCGKKIKRTVDRYMRDGVMLCKKCATEAYEKDISELKEQKNNLFVAL